MKGSYLIQFKKGRSRAVISSAPDFNNHDGRRIYIHPGETIMLCDIEGAAIINHIWLTFNVTRPDWLGKYGLARPDEVVLCMYWEDDKYLGVEAPLEDFFGAGLACLKERWHKKRRPLRLQKD